MSIRFAPVLSHGRLGVSGPERWLAKFEHWDKWNFCLNSAMMPWNRRDDDEAYPP
jgi:hypothetical protein